jgi:predicted Zn-dependent protease
VIADVAAEIANSLMKARYSRAKEQQADDFAFAFVMAYGYRPEALVSLFGKLGPDREASVLDSHPPSAARASRMRELIAKAKKQ